jgi:uncharacterized protein YjlB
LLQSRPETLSLPEGGNIPNSRLPLLIYRAALPADPGAMERAFAANGWSNSWRNGIYPFHHFHSIAHEVLGVARGEARVTFGGPEGRTVLLRAGDVTVIPAGAGHCNAEASDDFLVIGAYPGGADWDVRRGAAEEREEVRRNIAAVPRPSADPVRGTDGPLMELWAG